MFKMDFATDNAAFYEPMGHDEAERIDNHVAARAESARILRELADKLESGSCNGGVIRDSNGNRVGQWELASE